MKNLLRFEAYYFSRQPIFLLAMIVAIAIGYFLSGRVVIAGNLAFFSASNLTYFAAMFSLPALFIITLLSASILLRDSSNRFSELVYATPISNKKLQLSRFLGLFFVSTFLCLLTFVSYVAPTLMSPGGESVFGQFLWSNTLWPIAVILIPNVFIISSVLFFFSKFLQKTIWIYLTGLGIYVFYMFTTAYFDAPMFTASKSLDSAKLAVVSLFDPFAISAYLEQIQFWSSAEKNTLRASLEGTLLANRSLWLLFSCLLVALTLNRVPTIVKALAGFRRNKSKATKIGCENRKMPTVISKGLNQEEKTYSAWLMFKRSFSIEFFSVFSSFPFVLLILFTALLVTGQIIASVEMNSVIGAQYPYTSLLAPIIVVSLKIVSIITVGFYAAELAFRAKEVNFQQVLMATPISRWSLYLSQLLVLSVLILSLLFTAIVSAVFYQVLNGFYSIDWGLYASLISIYAMPMIFLAALCMSIQFAVNSKYAGIILSVIVMLIFGSSVAKNLGLEHVLVKFSSLATIRYSDFNGFDYFWANINSMLFHWLSYSIVLVFVGYALFNRTQGQTITQAITRLPKVLSPTLSKLMFISILVAFCSTAFVYWNTNVINSYRTSSDQEQHRVNYESQFSKFRGENSPFITDINVDVEFYPKEYTLQINGQFRLENTKEADIEEFIVSMPDLDIVADIEVSKASSIEHIQEFNTFLVKLNSPLKFNENLTLNFTSKYSRAGFKHKDLDLTLVSNGSYFHSEFLFPFIGFNSALGVIDDARRVALGLPVYSKRQALVANKQYNDHLKVKDANLVNFQARVSTEIDQIAVAPGDLIKQWTANNRQYFHYKVTKPTSNFFGFSSAQYKKLEAEQNGKLITIYYHPEHNKNIEQMMKTAKLSLARFSEQYSPYPFEQLTIAEIPYQGFARAYPGTIFFGESAGFKENLNKESNLDDFSSVVAHEVAHQWWGHQLKTANAQGATLLIEALAEYSSLTIMAEMYGEDYVKDELHRASTRYLAQRGQVQGMEPALYVMNDERYLRYEKGLVAFNSIAQKIGRETFNRALRQLLKDKALIDSNYATNLDLLSMFDGHEHQVFIDNWLTKVMLFDLALLDVSVANNESGEYSVTFTVNMIETDYSFNANGESQPSNQEVDYIIFTQDSEQQEKTIKGKAQLINGQATVSVLLNQKPNKIVLDPYYFFTDRNLLDNFKNLSLD